MIVRRLAAATLAALLTTACATTAAPESSSPAPVAVDPVGNYNFTSEVSGRSFAGVIRVARGQGGAYTGTISTPMTGSMPVQAVDVQGARMVVTARGQQGNAVMNLDFTGETFTGSWTYATAGGTLSGRRATAAEIQADTLPAMGAANTRYVGNYDLPDVSMQVRVFEQNGRLMAQATQQGAFPLTYLGRHRFQGASGIVMEFAVANGQATGFTLTQGGRSLPATRIP